MGTGVTLVDNASDVDLTHLFRGGTLSIYSVWLAKGKVRAVEYRSIIFK
ncbi:hypothetical protein ACNKHV_11275 [Shigella flexneri]